MKIYCLVILIALVAEPLMAQEYTRQDTLRGSITKERAWWDLFQYELSVSVNPTEQSIKGSNVVHYKVLEGNSVMQIDLQTPLVIDRVLQDGKALEVTHEGNAHFIKLTKAQVPGSLNSVTIEFS